MHASIGSTFATRFFSQTLRYIIAGLLCLTFSETALGQSKYTPSSTKKKVSKKKVSKKKKKRSKKLKKEDARLDITDIEKKYWAPKDTDFSVVQSRTYSKEKRFLFSGQWARLVNEPFSEGFNMNFAVAYFMSERAGVEFSYTNYNLNDNATVSAFLNDVGGFGGVKPDFGRLTNSMAVSYNWVPIYAKMSLLGKRIIYFDMAISPGLGLVNYDQISVVGNKSQSSVSFNLDITQYFFLTRNFAIRADLRNMWFSEDVVNFQTGVKNKSQTTNTSMFMLGVTYYY